MTQHNSQHQSNRQQIIGDIWISGNDNIVNNIQGDNNTLHFFKYEITPHGGVVNILPPEQAPRITARQTPIRLRPPVFSNLLGREVEVEQSVAALKALQTVELYGAAGVGKSVLLRHLAHHPISESLKLFPDGVVYFHLARQEPVEDGCIPPLQVHKSCDLSKPCLKTSRSGF
ncbi:MAG: ATP-binding protein [Cyanobacteria bacterium CAN_BIN43]|nr:ATP-binding protein [Cyanobacteria bacterium CAN_BIN43]